MRRRKHKLKIRIRVTGTKMKKKKSRQAMSEMESYPALTEVSYQRAVRGQTQTRLQAGRREWL